MRRAHDAFQVPVFHVYETADSEQAILRPHVVRKCVGGYAMNSRQNGRRGTAPFGHPVVRWRRARVGPWLSGLRPDAVSRMRLRALGGGGGIARAGWRGVMFRFWWVWGSIVMWISR